MDLRKTGIVNDAFDSQEGCNTNENHVDNLTGCKNEINVELDMTTENNGNIAYVNIPNKSTEVDNTIDDRTIENDKLQMNLRRMNKFQAEINDSDDHYDKENIRNIRDSNFSDKKELKSVNTDENCFKINVDCNRSVRKFTGVFLSLREKSTKKAWKRQSLRQYNLDKRHEDREPELTRSQYSLVSNVDLTAGALQLWLGLPEEVKYDPALAAFRQFYEKENAQESLPLRTRRTSAPKVKRLPAVNSAPHLNNNERVSNDPQNGPVYHLQEHKTPVSTENHDHSIHGQRKQTKWDNAKTYTKLTILVGCWVFFSVVFCLFNEKEVVARNCVLMPGQTKDFRLDIPKNHLTLLVDLSGPFLSEQEDQNMNLTEKETRSKVDVWVERWIVRDTDIKDIKDSDVVERENTTEPQSFVLLDSTKLDFSEAKSRSAKFEHHSSLNASAVYVIRMSSAASVAVPVSLSYQDNPIDVTEGVIYACLLLVMLYALIIFEVINRTLAAIMVSTLSLAVLSLVGERPSVAQLVSWLDVETLLLLLSMMLLVAIMAETGMFDFLAVFTFQVTKGKMWPLINVLCAITAVLSTFLDNVTTVLLITPVTIKLCEVMEMHPIPVLTAMVLYSNIGGTATPVGDPPNVIIASNQVVIQSGINFANFTVHMTLGILLVCVQTYLQLRFMYRDVGKLRPSEPREIQVMNNNGSAAQPEAGPSGVAGKKLKGSRSSITSSSSSSSRSSSASCSSINLDGSRANGREKNLRRQLNVWRRAADSLPHMSKDELFVKERLERKVQKISSQLATALKESNKRACPKDTFQRTLAELKEKYKIRDKKLLIKSCVAIGFVVIMFFLHAFPEFSRVSLGWTALLGAILLLILADREDIESILHRVEWSTLLFFAALFVLMEALTKLGLINYIGGLTEDLIMGVDETHRLAVALLLILWISGVTSAFVDNIPLTTMMVRVVTSLGTNPALGLPLQPLIWALSFGACLGGNGTLIGASANVVCAGVAEQHGYKFTFLHFFKTGFPIMIGHLVVASGYLVLCHCVLTWH